MVAARACSNELQQLRNHADAFREAGTDISLLSQAMHSISLRPKPKLDTLSLEVVVYDGGAVVEMSPKHKSLARYSKYRRERIFSTAMGTFRLVSLVLCESELSIHHLEAFGRRS